MSFEDKRFCVYLHRRKDTNEVFYVGSGTLYRSKDVTGRTKRWHKIVNECGFTVEIVESNLSKTDSYELETVLIHKFSAQVVNKISASSRTTDMRFEDFEAKLTVDSESPSGLVWKHGAKLFKPHSDKKLIAGSKDVSGYWRVRVNGKLYLAHRIVYLLCNRTICPLSVIDHIDRDRANNNIENLRQVSQQFNCRNKTTTLDSRCPTGVMFLKKQSAFMARIVVDHSTRLSRTFSCKKYGKEQALQLAIEWRKQKEKEHGFNPDCTDQTPDSR